MFLLSFTLRFFFILALPGSVGFIVLGALGLGETFGDLVIKSYGSAAVGGLMYATARTLIDVMALRRLRSDLKKEEA